MTGAVLEPVVLGIDPGRDKCGLAAVTEDGSVRQMMVVPAAELAALVGAWVEELPVLAIVVGDRSTGKAVAERLAGLGRPVHLAPEHDSTLRARAVYFADHPPRGWRRLIPLGFQVPPVPYDDYAALVIVQEWLKRGREA